MNPRKATLLLILGLLYTVMHKATHALLPSLAASRAAASSMNVLWLAATLALALLAYQFLRELAPRNRLLRYSLLSIIIFAGMVVVSKLPVWPTTSVATGRRLLFTFTSLFNSLAVLAFLLAFARFVVRQSPLWVPLRAATWACSLTAALGVASAGYFLTFLPAGEQPHPLRFLRPLALLSFLITYGTVLWFLITFRRIEDLQAFVNMGPAVRTAPRD